MKTIFYTIAFCTAGLLLGSCGETNNSNKGTIDESKKMAQDSLSMTEDLDQKKICYDLLEGSRAINSPGAFDSYDGVYNTSTGVFFKKMAVATDSATIGGNRVLLHPSVYNRFNVSAKDASGKIVVNAILEVLRHAQNDQSELTGNLVEVGQAADLNGIIGGFNSASGDSILVFSVHDENFIGYDEILKEKLLAAFEKKASSCIGELSKCRFTEDEYNKIIDGFIQPNTLGGGVIPPK